MGSRSRKANFFPSYMKAPCLVFSSVLLRSHQITHHIRITLSKISKRYFIIYQLVTVDVATDYIIKVLDYFLFNYSLSFRVHACPVWHWIDTNADRRH